MIKTMQEYSKRYHHPSPKKVQQVSEDWEAKRNFIVNLKAQVGCKCGEYNPIVLDFHHMKNDKKIRMANAHRHKWEIILNEIQRCEILCANCHRSLRPFI